MQALGFSFNTDAERHPHFFMHVQHTLQTEPSLHPSLQNLYIQIYFSNDGDLIRNGMGCILSVLNLVHNP